jgi:ATP-dependent phosphoenolpyruvate carboxykinase
MSKQGNLKTLVAFYAVIALIVLFMLPVKADRLYDEKGKYQGRIGDSGRLYDETGKYRGRIEKDRRYDNRGKYRGRIERRSRDGHSEREKPYRLDEIYDSHDR